MRLSALAAAATFAVTAPCFVAHAAETASATDKTFIAKVSQGGMFGVQAGQLAAAQGSTQDIRDQGNTEAHDHMLVGSKLKSIVSDEGLTFPSTLNPSFQKELADLKALQATLLTRPICVTC